MKRLFAIAILLVFAGAGARAKNNGPGYHNTDYSLPLQKRDTVFRVNDSVSLHIRNFGLRSDIVYQHRDSTRAWISRNGRRVSPACRSMRLLAGKAPLYYGKYGRHEGWGLMSFDGRRLTPPVYEQIYCLEAEALKKYGIERWSTRYFVVRDNETKNWGLIDSLGREILEAKYQKVTAVEDTVLQTINQGTSCYFNLRGEAVEYVAPEEPERDTTLYIYNISWRRSLQRDSMDALISKYHNNRVDVFSNMNVYENEYWEIRVDSLGRMAYCDFSGQPLSGRFYDRVYSFAADWALVRQGGAYGMIDTHGYEVLPPIYDRIFPSKYGYDMGVRQGGLFGVLDHNGNVVVVPTFDQMVRTYMRCFIFRKGEKLYVLTPKHKLVEVNRPRNDIFAIYFDPLKRIL